MGLGNPAYLQELVEHAKDRLAIFVYEPSFQIFLDFFAGRLKVKMDEFQPVQF